MPTSVHKLRPGDIDVIAAMGDSLTAGAGAFAHNLLQIIVENRGVAATGGGQGTWRQYLTLPNIIKVKRSIQSLILNISLMNISLLNIKFNEHKFIGHKAEYKFIIEQVTMCKIQYEK